MSFEPESVSPFWRFSCVFYARPRVSTLCIELQDAWGADINLVLLCVFAGKSQRILTECDLKGLDEACAPWRTGAITALRSARRFLKHNEFAGLGLEVEALRAAVGRVELEAERLQQYFLEDAVQSLGTVVAGASVVDLAGSNVDAYGASCVPRPFDPSLKAGLLQALQADLDEI